MKLPAILVALALTAPSLAVSSASAQVGTEQGHARRDMAEGVLPLREIEGLVIPKMRGMQYLGPEYDPAAKAYRLKFIYNGRVVFVDVDGRTGRILDRPR